MSEVTWYWADMSKSTSLAEFVAEIKDDVVAFEKLWLEKNKENPENYPLNLPETNAGLWFEFFMGYCESGEL